MQQWALRTQTAEIESFVTSLRGMDDAEIGPVLIMASSTRCSLIVAKVVTKEFFEGADLSSDSAIMVPLTLNRLVQQHQRDGVPVLATGAMVWLHSSRAMLTPPLRLLGRQMWAELMRGAPHVEEAADLLRMAGATEQAIAIIIAEAAFVPPPLTPRQ